MPIQHISFSIKLYTGKAYRDFMTLLADENLTDGAYDDLIGDFEGKIIVTRIDSADNFRPLYKGLPEICNLDGEFQIGEVVIKLTPNKIISITDPMAVDPAVVSDLTVTDTTVGLFVYNLVPAVSSGGCCPSSDIEENEWACCRRRRLTERYSVMNATTFVNAENGRYIVNPIILVHFEGVSERRNGWWPFLRWGPYSQTLTLDVDISITHNLSVFGLGNPINIDFTHGPSENIHEFILGPSEIGTRQSVFAIARPAELVVCVQDAFEELINSTPTTPVSVEIDCD